MTEDYGAIVARRGIDRDLPFQPGQDVVTYVLLAPLPPVVPPPVQLLSAVSPWNAHETARLWASEVHRSVKEGTWRVVGEPHRCRCPRWPALATEAVSPAGQRWVLLHRGESIPPAFKKFAGDDSPPKAWPLHREPVTGAPHVDLTMCSRCRRTYAVALTADSVTIIPTRPVYNARISE